MVSPCRPGRGMVPETKRRVPGGRRRREELGVQVHTTAAILVSLSPEHSGHLTSPSAPDLREREKAGVGLVGHTWPATRAYARVQPVVLLQSPYSVR